MKFEFEHDELRLLYEEGKGRERYPPEVVDAFVRRVEFIKSAADERDFYAMKSLHFEKLRQHSEARSMRLNLQWRLVLMLDRSKQGQTIVRIKAISAHYEN